MIRAFSAPALRQRDSRFINRALSNALPRPWGQNTKLRGLKQSAGIIAGLRYSLNGDVVARIFPLGVHAAREIPNRGMKKQNRFNQSLHKLQQMVVTTNVRQFMGEDCFDGCQGQSRGD